MSRLLDFLKKSSIANAMYGRALMALTLVSPEISTRVRFRVSKGYALAMNNPQTFDERISWLKVKLYNHSALVRQCADKLQVRSYVAQAGAEEILNPLYGVYSQVSEIDWETLPDQYVLKWSTGAGGVVICSDRGEFDVALAKRTLEGKIAHDSSLYSAELQYRGSVPKILCEKYVAPELGRVPVDYKFYCYEGEPKYVLVCVGRDDGTPTFYFYDMSWSRVVGFRKEGHEAPFTSTLPKPKGFESAKEYARHLAKPFPFVRVDLYLEHGAVTFGELTFTPCGGINSNLTELGDAKLGEPLQWLFEERGAEEES